MQSAYSDQFARLDGNYGYKVEVPAVAPGLLGMGMPWHSARDFRDIALRFPYTATFIILTRDKGEGRISLDSVGNPIVDYVTSAYDRKHLLHGLKQAARVHLAAGAKAVSSFQSKRTFMELEEGQKASEPQIRSFERQLERNGLGANRILMFSAHQMGTCRMGNDLVQLVVGGNSEVHGIKNLFVTDGSVFPSASSVNPMLSIMALAHRAAQNLKSW